MRKIMAVSVMIMMLLCGCASSSAEPKVTMSAPPLESETPDNEHLSSSKSEEESSFDPISTPTPIVEQESVAEIVVSTKHNVETEEMESVKSQTPKSTATPTPSQTPTPTPTPIPTPSPTPQVDIAYWVSYAKSCASSLGLTLNSSAVDCWDNPITATGKSTCLERDISSRLSRYAADEDITDVWIWSEAIGNGSYNIYIGYA